MVLGLRTKTHKSPSLHLDYVIHIDEVKPWPPSQSLRALRSVVIQWEQGEGASGLTNQVVPGDGMIRFNQSFRLKFPPKRDVGGDTYQNECVEFNLYEPGRGPNKGVGLRGQLLGSAVLDLGVVKENVSISIPIQCKRTYRNSVQPLLFLEIQPVDGQSDSGYAEEAEIASFPTDDDVSSHSSLPLAAATSPSPNKNKIDHKADKHLLVAGRTYSPPNGCTDNKTRQDRKTYEEEGGREFENVVLRKYPQADMQKQMSLENGIASSTKESALSSFTFSSIRKHSRMTDTSRGLDAKTFGKETKDLGRVQHLEHKIKVLEGELREAAGLEVGIYSVVAEHGSSTNKVHAPARRLSRLYFNANKHDPKSGRASASKSIVSGLVLVAKACGNDVPRLTFWLSNTIVLRAIVCKSFGESQIRGKAGEENGKNKSSPLTREGVAEKENLVAFVAALEKAEAWIFSRIIESLWWQSFTPHMQTGVAKAIRTSIGCNTSKLSRRKSSWSAEQQGKFSMELWKKALRDAFERICPVRGGGHGHDCGCLPNLSKLIMEQLVARLDVAMLNAILRESGDEIPTDPVADPISDATVLPIPAGKGKLSFGAGAQLKNVIGNWSRWVSNLFGMDEAENCNSSSKSDFFLLNALSDLMMLPKDMLFTPSIRKEVCPAFSRPLLIRILSSFVPDEFCPDPVPGALLEALITEVEMDSEERDSIVNRLPSEAATVVYKAPPLAAISPPLNKSQTNDDELDQLNSPLTGNPTSVRYRLLRELWNQD